MMKKLKILTSNIAGLRKNYLTLLSLLTKNKYSFLFLQETKLPDSLKNFQIHSNYYTSINNTKCTGLSIIIRKDWVKTRILLEDNYSQVILVRNIYNDSCMILANIHAPTFNLRKIQKNYFLEIISKFTNFQKFSKKLIIGGDFNCDTNTKSNRYNKYLEDFTRDYTELQSGPTRNRYTLDHIYVKNFKILKSNTKNYKFISDHKSVHVVLNYNTIDVINNKRLIITDVDLTKIEKMNLRNYSKKIYSAGTIKVINSSNTLKLSSEIQEIKNKIKICKEKKKLEQLKIEFKKELLNWKKKKLNELLEKAKIKPYNFLSEKKEVLQFVDIKKIEEICQDNEDTPIEDDNYLKCIQQSIVKIDAFKDEFTYNEIMNILEKLKKKKRNTSEGPDGINYFIWYKIFKKDMNLVMDLIYDLNQLRIGNELPKNLADCRLIPLKKDENNFRPISCLNCIYKLYTILLLNRLENKIKFDKSQLGFIKGLNSTEINLWKFQRNLKKIIDKNGTVTTWDLAQAFDSVKKNWLVAVLKRNFTANTIKTILNTMDGRMLFNNYSVPINKGTRQGSPLSPWLFNCCIDPLIRNLSNVCSTLTYADDVATFSFDTEQEIQINNYFLEFENLSKIKIKWEKTFSEKGNTNFTIKYLGIEFEVRNKQIYYNRHLERKIEIIKNRIQKIVKKKFIEISKIINYCNMLYSIINYGNIVFSNCNELIKKGNRIIKYEIKKFINLQKNIKDSAMEDLLGLKSLEKDFYLNKIRSFIRCYKNSKCFRIDLKRFSFKLGYPGLPANFNQITKKKHPISTINNYILKNDLKLITYNEKPISGSVLNIRARKNLLKRKIFFLKKKVIYYKFKKKFNFQMKLPNFNKMINNEKKDIFPCKKHETNIILNEKLINKKILKKFIFRRNSKFKDLKKFTYYTREDWRNSLRFACNQFPTFDIIYKNNNDPQLRICKCCSNEEENFFHLFYECKCPDIINIRKKHNFNCSNKSIEYGLTKLKYINEVWKFRNSKFSK